MRERQHTDGWGRRQRRRDGAVTLSTAETVADLITAFPDATYVLSIATLG